MYFVYCTSATRRFSFTFRWSWASLLWLGLTFIRIIHIKNCGKKYVGFYALGCWQEENADITEIDENSIACPINWHKMR